MSYILKCFEELKKSLFEKAFAGELTKEKRNMDWEKALHLLNSNIAVGLHLTPNANFKIVTEAPPYQCRNYNNVEGFRVQVGSKTFVNIPLEMLRVVFEASRLNNNIYNRSIFRDHFPRELNAKPCNVHSVGKLFEHAGVMHMIDSRNYRINNK